MPEVVTQPVYSWEKCLFQCDCKDPCTVRFLPADVRDPARKFRSSLTEGWTVRSSCPVCHKATARFHEIRDG
jgi:hypothetical protein